MDMVTCPECDQLAEVQWRSVLESTDGPIEHARIQCVRRHWFLLPVAALAHATAARPVRQVPTGTQRG